MGWLTLAGTRSQAAAGWIPMGARPILAVPQPWAAPVPGAKLSTAPGVQQCPCSCWEPALGVCRGLSVTARCQRGSAIQGDFPFCPFCLWGQGLFPATAGVVFLSLSSVSKGEERRRRGMLLEEWLLLQPRGFFPTVLGETRQIWFHSNSCMSEELDIGPWGDFCTGGGCVSWDQFPGRQQGCVNVAVMLSWFCHSSLSPPVLLSLLLCHPVPGCCSVCRVFYTNSSPPGAETPSLGTPVTLTRGQLQGGPFFASFAAVLSRMAISSPCGSWGAKTP